MEPGIYHGIPFEEYKKIDAFNYSKIRWILKSPKHFKYHLENPEPPSDAMVLGQLVDCLALSPGEFSSKFAVLPETYYDEKAKEDKKFNLNSTICKGIKAALDNSGKIVVKNQQIAVAAEMVKSLMEHEKIKVAIEDSQHQVCIVWIDCDTGVKCKGLVDMLCPDGITDLKTAPDVSPKAFPFKVNSFLYHVQGAFYSDGLTANSNGIILPYQIAGVESDPPYCAAIYVVEENSLLTGREIYKYALKVYKDCVENNCWPGYSQFVEPLNIPPYAISRVLEEGIING